ncbi:MAG: FxLYD domain-containing protein [Candidatus Eremiobacteraeota bacterium]|nr:FxLYD domain-containing protein [Candidatus Eremiobacteraeota bacterium]
MRVEDMIRNGGIFVKKVILCSVLLLICASIAMAKLETVISEKFFINFELKPYANQAMYTIEGNLTNRTKTAFSSVTIAWTLYNKDGAQLKSHNACIKNLEPNGTALFKETVVVDANSEATSIKLIKLETN